jgi:hypothetical protein
VRRQYLLLPPLFLAGIVLIRPAALPDRVKGAPTRAESAGSPPVPEGPLDLPSREATLPESEGVAETDRVARESENRYARYLQLRLLARRLNLAYLWLEQSQTNRCLEICSSILRMDPAYPVALDLVEFCLAGVRRGTIASALLAHWKQRTDDGEDPRVPEVEAFTFRDSEAWQRMVEEEFEENHIRRKLETMRIDLEFKDTSLEDITAYIRDFSGIDILIDVDCKEWLEPRAILNYSMKGAVLKEVLGALLSRYGLEYVVTDDKVIWVTVPSRAASFRRAS